jgi:hypothetical protein
LDSPDGCYRRKTFTERVPAGAAAMPAHAAAAGAGRAEVAGRGITPAGAARHAGISWPVAHEAFAAAADPVLERAPAPVAHLGIDEHLWVPKTCATWADALQIAVGSVPRSGAGRAGLGPSGDGMIFGLQA